jgi:hypothetical protein
LRYRGRKTLGWVPFSNDQVFFGGKAFTFNSVRYEPMHLREGVFYPVYGMSGSFNQDSRGRWYINIAIEVRVAAHAPNTASASISAWILSPGCLRPRNSAAEILSCQRREACQGSEGSKDAEAHPQESR